MICMAKPKAAVFLPCQHLCVCAECADSVRQRSNECPMCRAKIDSVIGVFL